MTRLLIAAALAAVGYELYALRSGRPTWSQLVRGTRTHFRPCPNYPNCRASLVPRPHNTPRPYGLHIGGVWVPMPHGTNGREVWD